MSRKNDTVKMVLVLLSLFAGVVSAQTSAQMEQLYSLAEQNPSIHIRWDKKTGVPVRISGILSEVSSKDAREIAMAFFKENKDIFGIRSAKEELSITKVKKDAHGWEHVTIQQVYKKLPVENKQIKVHMNKDKQIEVVNGNYQPNIDINTTPAISDTQAVAAARAAINPKKEPMKKPKSELVVYAFNGKNYLTWKIRIFSEDPLGDFIYYIDASNGEVIDSYNNFKTLRDRKTYDTNNSTNLPGTLKRSEGDAAVEDAVLNAAHDNAGTVYNYYKNTYGRDSFDNAGATIISTVHYANNYNNAGWTGSQMVYGDGDGVIFSPLSQSLDVVGHELTHAVTDNESQLVYRNQSGALNESLSDIFGVLMDPGDWMVGEDVYTPGTAGDALRYMDDPPKGNQPDHMDDFVVTGNDNGGVHTNSGIPNKAAFLMAAGGTHHTISVLGMGRANMGKVFYEAQINWLTSNSDFMAARNATLDAVAAIFPGDLSKHNTVQNAWAAVGLGAPSGLALELSPSPLKVSKNGGTNTLHAKVTINGSPIAGANVSFSSADVSRATVSSASVTTDAQGDASVTVTGHDKGYTMISSIAQNGTNATNASVQVKVPVSSQIGLIVMLLGMMAIVMFTVKKTEQTKLSR